MALPTLDALRNAFQHTLAADVKSLIRLHEKDKDSPGRPGDWLKAMRRSSVVLMTANLERFLEDTVVEGLTILANHAVVADRYPENFRLWVFQKAVNMRSVGREDARNFIDLSKDLFSGARALTLAELKLDELREAFANPTPKNVAWLMSLLDIEDYLTGIQIVVDHKKYWAKSVIGELSNRRNDIAHGDVNEDPDIDKVKMLSKFSQLFSTRFKRDVTKVIERCIP